jgi:hypothetical protein
VTAATEEAVAETPQTDAPAAFLAARRPTIIDQPGVYSDLRFEDYVKDPVPGGSLSNSEAKHLIPPEGCPARFRWEKDHKRPVKKEFEIGSAAHALVLGTGPILFELDAENMRTNKAKQEAEDARADGMIPLLPHEYRMVLDMAEAIRAHPVANALFSPDRGDAEQSLFWIDRPTGVWRRGRLDHLPFPTGSRMLLADYKSAAKADEHSCAKAVVKFGYHRQAATYLDGAMALGHADEDAAYLICFQEKQAPYLIHVFEVDAMFLAIARDQNRAALETYAKCSAENRWPAWPEPELLSPPVWLENAYLRGEL